MTGNQKPFGHINGRFTLALAGLFLSTGGALLSEPLLTFSQENSDSISILLAVYVFLFLFIPLTFFLNMLLLLIHVVTHVGAPDQAPLHFFFTGHLHCAARTVSVASLLLGCPLSVHVALAEHSLGSAIGPGLVCLASITVFISSFVEILIASCRTGTGFVPALFALCISTGLLPFVDRSYPSPTKTGTIPLSTSQSIFTFFLIPFTFMLGIILLILRITAPADGQQAAIRADHLATVGALSAAFATLLVSTYTMAYMAVTNMAAIGG